MVGKVVDLLDFIDLNGVEVPPQLRGLARGCCIIAPWT